MQKVFIMQIEAFKWGVCERDLFPGFICIKLIYCFFFIGMILIFPNDSMDAIIIWECLYC